MRVSELLLTEIARCPLVQSNLDQERPSHPCHTVVTHAWRDVPAGEREGRAFRENNVPEPWVGHIEAAPLPFVSSNPSLGRLRKAEPSREKDFAPPIKRIGEHLAADHPGPRRLGTGSESRRSTFVCSKAVGASEVPSILNRPG